MIPIRIKMPKGHSESAGKRREYHTPQLVRYGAMKDLTQSGTGNKQENTKKNGSCGGSQTRFPCASDRNLKENIIRIGEHPLGIGLYLFDYKPEFRDEWGHGRQFGVMAQEVEKLMPAAVFIHGDGYRMVDSAMLAISRADHWAEFVSVGQQNCPPRKGWAVCIFYLMINL